MKRLFCALFFSLSLSPRVVCAMRGPEPNDRALPCRPTIACTADIVPPGSFEVEVGYLLRDLPEDALQHSVPFLLKYTLTPEVQLQVASNGPIVQRQPVKRAYLDDIQLGAKWHLANQTNTMPAMALSGALSVPTFAAQNYLRTYDLLFTGYLTQDFATLHVDLNFGVNVWRIQDAVAQGFVALALSLPVTPTFSPMLEGYYFSDADPVSSRDGGILLALAFTPAQWIVLDVGGDVGLITQTRRFSAFVGATFIPLSTD